MAKRISVVDTYEKMRKLTVAEKYEQLRKQTIDAGMTITEKDGKLIIKRKTK